MFTLADIVDYAKGVSSCNRVTMLKTGCLARQEAKDRQCKDFRESDDYQIRHGRNFQGGVRTFQGEVRGEDGADGGSGYEQEDDEDQ